MQLWREYFEGQNIVYGSYAEGFSLVRFQLV